MLRRLALLVFCLALLGQAAGPALAALSSDCLCVEGGCTDEAVPACPDRAGCPAGSCTPGQAVLATAGRTIDAAGRLWATVPSTFPGARTLKTDLRPPIG